MEGGGRKNRSRAALPPKHHELHISIVDDMAGEPLARLVAPFTVRLVLWHGPGTDPTRDLFNSLGFVSGLGHLGSLA